MEMAFNIPWLELAAAGAAGLSLFMLALALATMVRGQGPMERRMSTIIEGIESVRRDTAWERFKSGMMDILKKIAPTSTMKDGWALTKIRTELITAGFRSKDALPVFMGIRVLVFVALPLATAAVCVALNTKQNHLLIASGVAVCLGFVLPSWVLEKISSSRSQKISRQLPNMLDLLVVAVESGLGLDSAVSRVTRDLASSCPTLAEELALFSLELRLGATREEALKNLANRTKVDEMGGLAAMLIQADRFGVSVGRSLRVFANEMRTKRRQKLEEAAAKIPLKLLIPVLFMIFPAIMAVMAGPAIINIMENMF